LDGVGWWALVLLAQGRPWEASRQQWADAAWNVDGPTSGAPPERIDRLIDEVDADPQPADELREIAWEVAEEAVYGLPAWDEVASSFKISGDWRGAKRDVGRSFDEYRRRGRRPHVVG
jgi:hypothetical protein